MSESVFKLIIIFFGLTNSLATFQAMINNLLRDIIEAENVAVFINNVTVEMEIEEKYNNIVKKYWEK